MKKYKKAFNYDLDDNLLQKHYPNPNNHKNARRDVKSFLCKNGFESRQYSGVISTSPMSNFEVSNIFEKLLSTFEWLEPCIQKFDVTDIKDQFSLIDNYRNEKDILNYADVDLNIDDVISDAKESLKDKTNFTKDLGKEKSRGKEKFKRTI